MEHAIEQASSTSALQPTHPLIESDSVEGTTVFGANGQRVGTIKRLVIEKVSGKVVYVVMSFGGFLSFGEELYTVPWQKLTYNPSLGGFRTDIDEKQLRAAPSFSRQEHPDWADREREKQLHRHYEVPSYYYAGF